MTAALVWVLWPASVFFTAVLSYRVGAYWSSTESVGRHRAGTVPNEDPWDEDEAGSGPTPAPDQAPRWWSDDDDTEVLPRVQDVRPPMSPMPVKMPWSITDS